MGLNHCVSYRGLPFNGTNDEYCQPPVAGNVAQTIGEIAFALSSKAGDPMRQNTIKGGGRKPKALQELQPVQQAVHVSRVLSHFKLSKPDKPAGPPFDILGQ